MNDSETIKLPRKLIETSLPLDAINVACSREKSIRHGHPSTLHLWWARRPLAAARAVIFAQMVNDPGWKFAMEGKAPTPAEKGAVTKKRNELFRLIEDMVRWENTTNKELFERAHKEIQKSWEEVCEINKNHPRAKELFNPKQLPAFHDPFAGGGALPLEAQRLGLESYASDLNPVAVLINKAMIEIPPKFANKTPINPDYQGLSPEQKKLSSWYGAQGLAEDVRYYGKWMRDEAERRIGHLYPKVEITATMAKERTDLKKYVGKELTVIAWLWARTVKSPNPAFANIDVPLASTFMLSTKADKEAYVEPVIEVGSYRFMVKMGKPKNEEAANSGTSAGKRAAFKCIMSGTPLSYDYIRSEGKAGRMGTRLMAIVAEGDRGRVYLTPTQEMEEIALTAEPKWKPDASLPANTRDFKTPNYGLTTFADIFTSRQLVALTTFSDLAQEARERVKRDTIKSGLKDDHIVLDQAGAGATAYADAVGVYLGCATGKLSDYNSTICSWISGGQTMRNTFGRQAIPMVWDYAEANVLSDSTGGFLSCVDQVRRVVTELPGNALGAAVQADAQTQVTSNQKVVSTDPPYYDNIGYADLSDFFYVWMRRSLKSVFPDLFATLTVPKSEELVATPYRHGSKEKAETFFLNGMTQAMHRLAMQAHPAFPVTIYYAFKQAESDGDDGTTNTGWETFLDAVIRADFSVVGTWPMRTEMGNRMIGSGTNALASSIVLVCRKRAADALSVTRRDFEERLKKEMPEHFDTMISGGDGRSPVGPVDLQQAAIGPGMGIFSSYSAVLKADGSPMSVRDALSMINKELDAYLNSFGDPQTNFALVWFEQHGWLDGPYGDADTLARAKGITIQDAANSGILISRGGQVRLLRQNEYEKDWDVEKDKNLPQWEALHRLALAYSNDARTAGALLAKMNTRGLNTEDLRQLAYRLYVFCERKGWASDAGVYNTLMEAWGDISTHAVDAAIPTLTQKDLFIS